MVPCTKLELLVLVSVALTAGCLASASTFVVEYQPNKLPEIETQLSTRGYRVVRQYPSFNRLVVSGGDLAATASTPGSGSFDPEDLVRQVSAELAGLGGVHGVAKGGMRSLFPQPVISETYYNYQGTQDQQANGTCGDADGKLGPDADLGRSQEGVPYGIHMVQADDPVIVEISKNFKNKVLYCVIDTGLDPTNTEFYNESTSGCMPGFPNGDTNQPYKYCYDWYNDGNRHGTHTSGTIAARRNGQGVVGVSAEGAQVYHYNYFGPNMEASDDLEVAAWQECIAELDRRKASTSNPDMKLVISMSYGSFAETEFSKSAISSLTKQRNDVLWIAAAGNSGDNSTNFPAGYDEVISIGAVDWDGKPADFSTYNDDVELAAPGVQTLSTIPLALSNTSDYHFRPYSRDILTVAPPMMETSADLNKPKVNRVEGTPTGNMTAGLVNCGLANNGTCQGVQGKICLIQRGNNTFCDKIMNCAAGGGVGVVIYNKPDVDECEALTGVSVGLCGSAPEKGWPLVVTTSCRQGKALASTLSANPQMNATIRIANLQPQTNFGLELLSGTSMATPTASGVAGLVWSAHTRCTAAEIREALIKTAWKPDNSTGRDQHYGYGVVQAKTAHEYLTAHPCKGQQLNVTVKAKASKSPPGKSSSSDSDVKVKVTVVDSSTGQPVADQPVKLQVKPSRKALICKTYSLTTNSMGVASTSCVKKQGGKVSVTAKASDASATSSVKSG